MNDPFGLNSLFENEDEWSELDIKLIIMKHVCEAARGGTLNASDILTACAMLEQWLGEAKQPATVEEALSPKKGCANCKCKK